LQDSPREIFKIRGESFLAGVSLLVANTCLFEGSDAKDFTTGCPVSESVSSEVWLS
jgi:hypothetical protein